MQYNPPLSSEDFNSKWGNYLETGHYGCDIDEPEIIKFLDEQFIKFIIDEGHFDLRYSQIKLKYGTSRVYTNYPEFSDICEEGVDRIIKTNK